MNLKRIIISVFIIAVFAAFLVLFNKIDKVPLINSSGKTYAKAEVTEILTENGAEAGGQAGAQYVMLDIKSGSHKGEQIKAVSNNGYLYGVQSKVGMTVTAVLYESNGEVIASVSGAYRINAVIVIALLFLLSIWLIGGRKGLTSIIGLIFTFVTILWLFLPMIYRGISPFFAAVVSCSLTTVVCMPLIGGITKKTLAAVISTVAGVVIAGLLAYIFGKMTGVTGYNVSEIDELMYISANTQIKVGELLFSGILIASLGAVMDVGMSVASAVDELHIKNPVMTRSELLKSGMNVGRDMMGTMSNTLILAFVGTSINTIVTMYAYDYPAMYIMNLYSTCIEIIRGISGSMAVVFTVPITAAISSLLSGKPES
ncbi:MAG: YibE/F family protein [Candidatus Ornithomonoglobus sp.]